VSGPTVGTGPGGVDTVPASRYESHVAKKSESSRVPSAVGAIPVVGGLVKNADAQARWMQDVLEQNARLLGQLPATMKTFNDSLERFNQTIGRLDRAVTQLEKTSRGITGPIERVASALDPKSLGEIPHALDSLRQSLTDEALPALRAANDTQKQVALLQSTVDRMLAVIAELPGAGILRRITAGRDADPETPGSRSARPARKRPAAKRTTPGA
jgi:ABC-type transporter Mla subunit MlaD